MIALNDVVKRYGGPLARLRGEEIRALDGVSLEVPPGTSLGVIGPNGAGKSTLVRVLLGFVRPSAGAAAIGGMPPRAYVERHGIGYVPEDVAIPPGWTVRRALNAYAALGEVPAPGAAVERWMERLGLAPLADRRVGALSKGNRQRLALAQALMGPRRVLVLDEPSDGLDPHWIARVGEMVRAWRAAEPERVLVFASHDLEQVERLCDRVAVLREGRVHTVLDLAAERAAPGYRLHVAPGDGAADRVRGAFPGAAEVDAGAGVYAVRPETAAALQRGLAALVEAGVPVRALAPGGAATLRERYAALAVHADAAAAAAGSEAAA